MICYEIFVLVNLLYVLKLLFRFSKFTICFTGRRLMYIKSKTNDFKFEFEFKAQTNIMIKVNIIISSKRNVRFLTNAS